MLNSEHIRRDRYKNDQTALCINIKFEKETLKLISLVVSVFLMGKLMWGKRKMKEADHLVPCIECYHSRVLYTEDSKYCRYARDDSMLLK